jgi:hypothetical protein
LPLPLDGAAKEGTAAEGAPAAGPHKLLDDDESSGDELMFGSGDVDKPQAAPQVRIKPPVAKAVGKPSLHTRERTAPKRLSEEQKGPAPAKKTSRKEMQVALPPYCISESTL